MAEDICFGTNTGKYGGGNMKIIDISANLGRFLNGGETQTTSVPEDSSKFDKANEFLKKIQSLCHCSSGSKLISYSYWKTMNGFKSQHTPIWEYETVRERVGHAPEGLQMIDKATIELGAL